VMQVKVVNSYEATYKQKQVKTSESSLIQTKL